MLSVLIALSTRNVISSDEISSLYYHAVDRSQGIPYSPTVPKLFFCCRQGQITQIRLPAASRDVTEFDEVKSVERYVLETPVTSRLRRDNMLVLLTDLVSAIILAVTKKTYSYKDLYGPCDSLSEPSSTKWLHLVVN